MSLIRSIKVRKVFCWKRDKKDPYILSPSARVWMCTWTISTRYSRATDYRCVILILKFSTAQIQIPNRKSCKTYENLSFFQKVHILFGQSAHLAKIFGIFGKKTLIGVRSPWVTVTHSLCVMYLHQWYRCVLSTPFGVPFRSSILECTILFLFNILKSCWTTCFQIISKSFPFEGWPNRARPSHPFWQNGLNGRALLGQPSKGHPCRVLILFL